jgi:hypothetical protein
VHAFGPRESNSSLSLSFSVLILSSNQEATEICVRAAKWPALTERVVSLFERAGNLALEAGELEAAVSRLTLCIDLSFPPSESVLYSRACAYQRKVTSLLLWNSSFEFEFGI